MSRLEVAAITAMGFCMIGAAGQAQESRWDRQVGTRLAQVATALRSQAYRADGVPGRGTLNTGETVTFPLTLTRGVAAVLAGVCDDDCDQLELSLSANGYETDAARGGNNAPIVRVTPRETVTYRVTVRMASCRMNPCWYGVGVFLAP